MISLSLLALFCGMTGCGYNTSELYPQRYRTVAVPIAQNQTFYRGVEDVLTEALVKQVEQRTPYKRVAPNTADTLLLVTVTGVRDGRISRTRIGGIPQELETLITVDVEWRDLATGETILTRRGLSGPGRYIPAGDIADRSEYGQWTAADGLADRIVSVLREDW
ncbi:MAG: LPS assembly lipoprotein LptE [Planctomycetota bacterium]